MSRSSTQVLCWFYPTQCRFVRGLKEKHRTDRGSGIKARLIYFRSYIFVCCFTVARASCPVLCGKGGLDCPFITARTALLGSADFQLPLFTALFLLTTVYLCELKHMQLFLRTEVEICYFKALCMQKGILLVTHMA